MKLILTREQIDHLIELGLDVKSKSNIVSDSFFNIFNSSNFIVTEKGKIYCDPITGGGVSDNIDLYYTFTLNDILSILPKRIQKSNCDWYLFVDFFNEVISYSDEFNFSFINRVDIIEGNCLDAAYELLCWCIENDFLNN